jgi:GT2 family glycosyltransferase
MKKLAVVILNWNGAAMLREFLPSVVAFSENDETEVVVADNASTDASCDVVTTEFPSVRLIRLEENFGFAEGYNRALAQIEAERVVLLNSDVEVTEGWLKPLNDYLDAHPDVAAVQPKLLSQRAKSQFEYAGACGGFIDRYGYPFCRGRILGTVEEDHGQYDTPLDIFWASGAALCIRLQDYREVGGLDGRFFAHMEEIDLCWRLRSRGRKIACVPASRVYHVGGATLQTGSPRKTYLNFRNNLLMLYKNLPEEELSKVLFVRGFLDYVAMLQFLLKGDKASARAVLQARRDYHATLPQFAASRIQNMMKSTDDAIPERMHGSILVKYYLRGKKRFSQIFS